MGLVAGMTSEQGNADRKRAGDGLPIARRGMMLVLSSPSGAGKTTLSRQLLQADSQLELSVSVTTRKQRPGEVEGRDYYFIDKARFDAMAADAELLEWAQVFGHCYGTPRAPVETALGNGRDVLFDIDWQGTQQLREKADRDLVSIFILPRPFLTWNGGYAVAPRMQTKSFMRGWPRRLTR